MDLLCTHHERRKVSKQLSFQYRNRACQIEEPGRKYRLRGQYVTVYESFTDGAIRVLFDERPVSVSVLAEGPPGVPLADEQNVLARVGQARREQRLRAPTRPPATHPWRRSSVGKARLNASSGPNG